MLKIINLFLNLPYFKIDRTPVLIHFNLCRKFYERKNINFIENFEGTEWITTFYLLLFLNIDDGVFFERILSGLPNTTNSFEGWHSGFNNL